MSVIATMANGRLMERQEELRVYNQEDLDKAIFSLQFYFNEARFREEAMIVEVWMPKVYKVPRGGG